MHQKLIKVIVKVMSRVKVDEDIFRDRIISLTSKVIEVNRGTRQLLSITHVAIIKPNIVAWAPIQKLILYEVTDKEVNLLEIFSQSKYFLVTSIPR